MYRLFEIAFELHDWKSQPGWVKVLSAMIVAGIVAGFLREVLL
ncbi:hypothetical protein [Qipengyuania vesicularis]|nr:hypothetical protein [Qipengyuania vesicularis]